MMMSSMDSMPDSPPAAVNVQMGTSLVNNTTIASSTSANTTMPNTATLMVLNSTSANTQAVNGNIIMSSAPGSNQQTVTVRATGSGSMPGAKTIVVMPVSNALGSGDSQAAKRLKVEYAN